MSGKKTPKSFYSNKECTFCGAAASSDVPLAQWETGTTICPACLCDEYDMAAESLDLVMKVFAGNPAMKEAFLRIKSDNALLDDSDIFDGFGNGAGTNFGNREQNNQKNAATLTRNGKNAEFQLQRIPTPRAIKEHLDSFVVGQDQAKKTIAVAVHNHYKRVFGSNSAQIDAKFKDIEVEKSNILVIGPTGTGKTLIARTLAKFLDVPFAIADATTLTEAGYVGEDVENILLNLIQAAGGDVKKAEHGIIFVDEIDKIGRRTENVSITRDVSGEGVQQALLKILEGTVSHVPPFGGRKHPEQKYIEIETKDILFICGGAFVGLDASIKRRRGKSNFGFGDETRQKTAITAAAPNAAASDLELLRPEPEDLIHFGLIPEFVGRLPVVAALAELTEADLRHILTVPKNSLVGQYCKLMAMDGVELTFDEDAIAAIAKESVKRKTGARGLRAIMEELMLDVMYDAASYKERAKGAKLIITAQLVEAQLARSNSIAEALRAY